MAPSDEQPEKSFDKGRLPLDDHSSSGVMPTSYFSPTSAWRVFKQHSCSSWKWNFHNNSSNNMMKPKRISTKLAALTAMALFCCVALITTSKTASAQPPNCNCLTLVASATVLCDTCFDSIQCRGVPPHQICDTFMYCDTCWTFGIMNNCDSAIGSFTIYDGTDVLHHGCAAVEDPTHATWNMTNNGDGSVSFTPMSGDPCLAVGKTLLVSICLPLKQGDTINILWTYCGGTMPCPPPGEQSIVP